MTSVPPRGLESGCHICRQGGWLGWQQAALFSSFSLDLCPETLAVETKLQH